MVTEIELADGTRFEGSVGIPDDRHMRLKITKELAQLHLLDFMDPAKMAEVKFYYGVHWDVYKGFSKMMFMEPAPENLVYVWLLADGEPSVERELTKVPDVYLQ